MASRTLDVGMVRHIRVAHRLFSASVAQRHADDPWSTVTWAPGGAQTAGSVRLEACLAEPGEPRGQVLLGRNKRSGHERNRAVQFVERVPKPLCGMPGPWLLQARRLHDHVSDTELSQCASQAISRVGYPDDR